VLALSICQNVARARGFYLSRNYATKHFERDIGYAKFCVFFAIWREKKSERISDEVNHQEVIGLAYNKQESTRREGNIEGGDGGRA
jgi:hypothetical protein